MKERKQIVASFRNAAWRSVFYMAAVLLSAILCITPASLAVWAWITHFEWLRSGDYSRNSFPMEAFAVGMTWTTVVIVLIVVTSWLIVWQSARRKNRRGGAT